MRGAGLSWYALSQVALLIVLIGGFLFAFGNSIANLESRTKDRSPLIQTGTRSSGGVAVRSFVASPTSSFDASLSVTPRRDTLISQYTLAPSATATFTPINQGSDWQNTATSQALVAPRASATSIALTVMAAISPYPSSTPVPLRLAPTSTAVPSGVCVRVVSMAGQVVYVNVVTGEFC